jgi:hypothetical protein
MRGVRLQLVTLLAVLAMLVSGGATAGAQYLCHMSGRVVATCCCGTVGPPALRSVQQARPVDCCERIVTPARAALIEAQDLASHVPGPTLVAVLSPADYAPLAAQIARTSVRSARAPPRPGSPLFVMHCALLI